ncbi:MAG: hypothetical protein GXP26_02430 [Planctomycetes bacterium]|nr:hypothetical protein [Planctomycetota bacterium]
MCRVPLAPYGRFVFALCLALLGSSSVATAQLEFKGLGNFRSGGRGNRGAEVTVKAEFTAATEERSAYLFVTATIADNFHISAVDQGSLPNHGGGPLPSKPTLAPDSAASVTGEWRSTEPPHVRIDQEAFVGLELREHFKNVTWYAPIELAPGTDPNTLTLEGKVEGQACNPQTCIPFETPFTAKLGTGVPVPVATATEPTPEPILAETPNLPLFTILGYGILGGLILNLMPCVLPVIGLKVLSFAEQGGQSRAHVFLLNLSYVAGLFSVFMVLATLAALAQLGLGNESFGWGELYTLTWFKVAMTALVFAMALSFLGTWELPIPGFAASGSATELAAREGPFGAFCMGIVTTLLATPCSGPFLGPVFGYTISQPPWVIYAIFGSVGLGMSLPYLLIGVAPSLVSWIPKPGAWMNTMKHLLGFVLLGTVVYLFSTINQDYFLATLALLFGIWFGCWLIGQTSITASEKTRRNAWLGAIGSAAIVGVFAFKILTPSDALLPWQPYSPQALAAARAEGKTVLVDFSANWCPTCKTNLKFAINRTEVRDLVEKNNVVTLLADWTDRSETIKNALRELNSQSIPLLAIYPADPSREVIVLPDLLSKSKVLKALSTAGPSLSESEKSSMATTPKAPVFGGQAQQVNTYR